MMYNKEYSLSLYKRVYNDNEYSLLYMKMYFYYTRRCIMIINISIIHEDVFLLYETMYNKNICCHYTREYIMTTNILIIHESVFLLYEMMYNDNKYFYYT